MTAPAYPTVDLDVDADQLAERTEDAADLAPGTTPLYDAVAAEFGDPHPLPSAHVTAEGPADDAAGLAAPAGGVPEPAPGPGTPDVVYDGRFSDQCKDGCVWGECGRDKASPNACGGCCGCLGGCGVGYDQQLAEAAFADATDSEAEQTADPGEQPADATTP